MCSIKSEACCGRCSPENRILPVCCATYSTSTFVREEKVGTSTVKLYKLEIESKTLEGTEDFLNTLSKTLSNMRLANYNPASGTCPTKILPNECSITSSFRNSVTSTHGQGKAVDICCTSKTSSTITQLIKDLFQKGNWPGYIISEITPQEQECNETKNCPFLIHLEYDSQGKTRPSTTPCLLKNCNFYTCYSLDNL